MDIATVKIHETSILKVLHPQTGVETDIVIEIFGSDTCIYKKAVSAMQKKNRKRKDISMEAIERLSIELLVVATKGWTNIEENKKEVLFTEENAIRIYTELPWLRKQIDEHIGDDQNFLTSKGNN